jgi:hypothetical protein
MSIKQDSLKCFPRYNNKNPIHLTEVPAFFKDEYTSFFKSLQLHKDTYPLHALSIDISTPYDPFGYIIVMCIDLDNDDVFTNYNLSVEIPFTDVFLPIKNDAESIRKAIKHIIDGTIQMLNVTRHIDTTVHDYVRL